MQLSTCPLSPTFPAPSVVTEGYEQTAVGKVARTARAQMYRVAQATEEDDLAGVSTLMKVLPDEAGQAKATQRKRKPAAKKKRTGKK